MEIFESSIFLLRNTANILTDLLTVIIAILIIGFIVYLKYDFCRKYEKWEKEKFKSNNKSKKEYSWQCLLIDGVWGSGKTTHYEKEYQYIDDKPNIYISCFSASRSELIAQIIQQQFWYRLLTLNGLLAKLMESNWQVFMPKNRVIVFDDLERLHANQDNYLDLIGIIDYLKDKNKCKIILICNMSELKEPIFNTYMERIVDRHEYPELMQKNEFINKLLNESGDVTKKILDGLYKHYESDRIVNLRVIKNIIPQISKLITNGYSEFSEIEHLINGSIYEIIKLINKHYLFYSDNNLFISCVDFLNSKKADANSEEEKTLKTNLQSKLTDYSLVLENFICDDFKGQRDINKILQPDFKDFLRLNIEANLSLYDDGRRIQDLVIEYLEKYESRKTKNNFIDGSYSILLLYVLHNSGNVKYNELFDKVLSQSELMNKDKLYPIHSDLYSLLTLLRNTYIERFKKLFKIEKLDEKDFLIKYYDYYRNKIINKFINLTNQIDYDASFYFGVDWFKNEYSSVDYELIDEKKNKSALETIYSLTNECINLYIIQKWVDNNVSKETLFEYYCLVINSMKLEITNEQKDYISTKIDEFVNFSSEKAINKIRKTDTYQTTIDSLSEKYGSFDKMRDKLFRFKQMVADYIQSDANVWRKFNEYDYENQDIVGKLFVKKISDSVENHEM